MGGMPLAWQLVRVAGPSMVPTLYDGDVVLVRHGAHVRDGDVVLARFRSLPDRFVVKRTVRSESGLWLLGSDNDAAGGDSRSHGPADVLGRVVLRWPDGRRIHFPRRVRRGSGHLPGPGTAVTDSTNR
jgi:phage repressor protein C with HTH and peptisase S24 domain